MHCIHTAGKLTRGTPRDRTRPHWPFALHWWWALALRRTLGQSIWPAPPPYIHVYSDRYGRFTCIQWLSLQKVRIDEEETSISNLIHTCIYPYTCTFILLLVRRSCSGAFNFSLVDDVEARAFFTLSDDVSSCIYVCVCMWGRRIDNNDCINNNTQLSDAWLY